MKEIIGGYRIAGNSLSGKKLIRIGITFVA